MEVARTNVRKFEKPRQYNNENQTNATDVGKNEDQRKDRSMQLHLKLAYGHFEFQRKSLGSLSIPFYRINISPYINIHMYSWLNTVFFILKKSITLFCSWVRSFLLY